MQQSNATHDRRAIISSSRSNPCLFFYGNYDYRGAMLREFRTMKAKTRVHDGAIILEITVRPGI